MIIGLPHRRFVEAPNLRFGETGCGNVPILLLAQGTARQHRFAVRAAVGANIAASSARNDGLSNPITPAVYAPIRYR